MFNIANCVYKKRTFTRHKADMRDPHVPFVAERGAMLALRAANSTPSPAPRCRSALPHGRMTQTGCKSLHFCMSTAESPTDRSFASIVTKTLFAFELARSVFLVFC